jgi:hypothetical protein
MGSFSAAWLIRRQNSVSALFAPARPPVAMPDANTVAFIAPALVALTPSISMRSSSSRRSRTPQVKAPCAPPPCKARLRGLVLTFGVGVSQWIAIGSLPTLASIISAPCRGDSARNLRALFHGERYGAGSTGGNAERVLCACAAVIALPRFRRHLRDASKWMIRGLTP